MHNKYFLCPLKKILVYIARWTSVISEEVCDMGSYRTRRQPSVIRAHITHFFTYHTSPRVIYSLYHNNCPICLLFIEVLPKMSIKPSKTHEIKTWKITKYFCSVISYFGKTYHTLPQCDLDSQSGIRRLYQVIHNFIQFFLEQFLMYEQHCCSPLLHCTSTMFANKTTTKY